jgi:hypothetical protein
MSNVTHHSRLGTIGHVIELAGIERQHVPFHPNLWLWLNFQNSTKNESCKHDGFQQSCKHDEDFDTIGIQ